MMRIFRFAACFWLQEVPPSALVLAMALAYVLCFAGMLCAYLAYRRRRKSQKSDRELP